MYLYIAVRIKSVPVASLVMYRKGDQSIFHFVLQSQIVDVHNHFSERIGEHTLSLIFEQL